MTTEQKSTNSHLEQGKALASLLFDYKLSDLDRLASKHPDLRKKYSLLNDAEYKDVVNQVRSAKITQQKHYGWHLVPRDLAVILVTALTWLLNDWKLPLVFGIFLLILLANIFAMRFSEKLSLILGASVWVSYLALLAYGWYFLRNGSPWYIALLAVLGLALGSMLLIGLNRMMLAAMAKARSEASAHMAAEGKQPSEKTKK
ncbi:MAG TPA: hypothetical protein VLR89_02470 [Anaerolineaceae bacterium]|nr:hypothetical protein [Anaerolineaceae bacterium]